MKRFLTVTIVIVMFLMVGCSSDSPDTESNKVVQDDNKTTTDNETTVLRDIEAFKQMYSNPDKYKDQAVEFPAKIFLEPEVDGDDTAFQGYAYNNDDFNTIVFAENISGLDYEDIVMVKGVVNGMYEGENAFGAKLEVPVIYADSVEKIDYATAFSPALNVIEINEEINQHGYVMKVEKVEFAEDETRVYITVENNTDDNISFYSFNAKAVQGSTQLEEKDTWDQGYKEVESELLPGVKDSGIIVFGRSNPDENLKIYLEGSSDNYELDFEPFIFETE